MEISEDNLSQLTIEQINEEITKTEEECRKRTIIDQKKANKDIFKAAFPLMNKL